MRPTTRLIAMVSVIVINAALFAGTVLASNTRTHSGWWHGLGDGQDNDNYLHPFNDNSNNQQRYNSLALFRDADNNGSAAFIANRLDRYTEHTHIDYSPGSIKDCAHFSNHEGAGMSVNRHTHHSDCLSYFRSHP